MAEIDHPLTTHIIPTLPETQRVPAFHEMVCLFFIRLRWLIEHEHFRGPMLTNLRGGHSTIFLPRRLNEIYEILLFQDELPANDVVALNAIISFVRTMKRGETDQSFFGFGLSLCVFQKELRALTFLAHELNQAINQHNETDPFLGLQSTIKLCLEFWHRRLPTAIRNDMYTEFGNEDHARGIRDIRHLAIEDIDDDDDEFQPSLHIP